jgi:uncharacterized lipoprotein YajG
MIRRLRAVVTGAFSLSASAGALSLLSVLISGCAFTEGHVNLEYQPQAQAAKVAAAAAPHVVVQVADQRPTKVVGQKINGFGMKTADILSDNDLPATLKGAFESELSNRGFTVGTGGATVEVTLNSLQNQFTPGFFSGESTANIGIDVSVKRADGAVAYEKYFTGQNQESVQIFSAGNAEETLNAAIKDAVGKVFSDDAFIAALQKP